MFKTIQYIVVAVLCLNFSSKAQFYKPSDKTIRVGESLPNSFYQTLHQAVNAKTGKTTTIQLKDYRDKLIILDFWATWCSPCRYYLKVLDSIQKKMSTKNFIVVPVTYQKKTDLEATLSKLEISLNSIISDTILVKIFPHDGIPHQIWIKNGKVLTIPKADYANENNIQRAINGDSLKIPLNIQDKMVDPYKPLFKNGNGDINPYFKAENAVIARYIPGYRAELLQLLVKNDTTILYCINNELQQISYEAYKNRIFPALDISTGVIWNISDSLKKRLFNPPPQSLVGNYQQDSLYNNWIKHNTYGYELRYAKPIAKNAALGFMQDDLNRFFGLFLNLKFTIENHPKKFLVLRTADSKTTAIQSLTTKGGEQRNVSNNENWIFYNSPFNEQFILHLEASDLIKNMQIIDSTGIDPKLRVDFISSKKIFQNLEFARKELSRYGLTIRIEELTIPQLVITEMGVKESSNN